MIQEISYKEGQMTKDPRMMTADERAMWQRQCAQDARDYLFSIGQPSVYKRPDGHTVAEYKDGTVQIVR